MAKVLGLLTVPLLEDASSFDHILAVPLHSARLRERGFNQSELIAAVLRRHFKVRPEPGALTRERNTPTQVGLDRERRRSNVAGAFAWTGDLLHGRRILLVDDVFTTGVTLDSCAQTLRDAGAIAVTGVTVARVGL
ncbi:MAG TPA: hypothetical protein VG015_03395 [Candidatus Dormibacteraeota bacterium]|nr:hypothetical protein [Candidatus Dormibacteraeota bacterium]